MAWQVLGLTASPGGDIELVSAFCLSALAFHYWQILVKARTLVQIADWQCLAALQHLWMNMRQAHQPGDLFA